MTRSSLGALAVPCWQRSRAQEFEAGSDAAGAHGVGRRKEQQREQEERKGNRMR